MMALIKRARRFPRAMAFLACIFAAIQTENQAQAFPTGRPQAARGSTVGQAHDSFLSSHLPKSISLPVAQATAAANPEPSATAPAAAEAQPAPSASSPAAAQPAAQPKVDAANSDADKSAPAASAPAGSGQATSTAATSTAATSTPAATESGGAQTDTKAPAETAPATSQPATSQPATPQPAASTGTPESSGNGAATETKAATEDKDKEKSEPTNYALTLLNACHSESVLIAEYLGYDKGDIHYNNPPKANYKIVKVLKGPPLNKSLPIKYEFHDHSDPPPPKGWKFSDSLMPEKGSKWIVFIPHAVPKNGMFETYEGSYGIQPDSEENLNAVFDILRAHNEIQ